jgi:formate dehydrogenase maturation protein FdhE
VIPASPPAGSAPAEPRDVAALRRLRTSNPDLAPAIDFQLAWLQTERRIDTRVPLPRTVGADAVCAARLAAGAPVLEFDDLVLDWSDVRRLCGQAADLLRRADFLEPEVEARALACLRDASALPTELRRWFDRDPAADAGAAQVWTFGLRPDQTRAAAALLPRLPVAEWHRPTCLVCGGDAEFAAWSGGERRLVCGRCAAQWTFDASQCPHCLDDDPASRQSFSDPSRVYRVEACTRCRRYVKGLDEERAGRTVLTAYDPIATIPLDAAAAQLGFE